MIFIETSSFTKLLTEYLSDDEYRMLQWHLQEQPEAGAVVAVSGKFDGRLKAEARAAGFGLFTTGRKATVKSGC